MTSVTNVTNVTSVTSGTKVTSVICCKQALGHHLWLPLVYSWHVFDEKVIPISEPVTGAHGEITEPAPGCDKGC